MSSEDREEIDFDEKTVRVLKRKGYIIDKRLSAGAFGQVFKAIKENSKELAAVKVMELEKVSEKFKKKFLPRELAALTEVDHKHIIKVFDIFRSNKRIYIFMEFAGGGDLSQYLKDNGHMNEPTACKWFSQIVDALNYLHNHLFMAHRDLKIDNILLSDDQNDAKLTDFGFAKEAWDQKNNKVVLSSTTCGTEPYYSPELVKRVNYDPFKADVWAMGVVLFAMINNKFPFKFNDGPKQMLKQQLNPQHIESRLIKRISKHLKKLFNKLFDTNESNRIGMNDILKDKWVREEGKCKH